MEQGKPDIVCLSEVKSDIVTLDLNLPAGVSSEIFVDLKRTETLCEIAGISSLHIHDNQRSPKYDPSKKLPNRENSYKCGKRMNHKIGINLDVLRRNIEEKYPSGLNRIGWAKELDKTIREIIREEGNKYLCRWDVNNMKLDIMAIASVIFFLFLEFMHNNDNILAPTLGTLAIAKGYPLLRDKIEKKDPRLSFINLFGAEIDRAIVLTIMTLTKRLILHKSQINNS